MTADADGLQATWSEVNQLLQSEQYNQAAELLNRIHVAGEQAGNQLVASSAAAVRQICLACSQLQATGEWHQQVGNEAGQRQYQLKAYAQSIVLGLGDRDLAEPCRTRGGNRAAGIACGGPASTAQMVATNARVVLSIKRFFVPQQRHRRQQYRQSQPKNVRRSPANRPRW